MFTENESYKLFRDEASKVLNNTISEFTKYQDLALKTLYAVDQVCRKNCIDYYLAYGSLLGAIRDKGLIPWDYDIDIWIKGDDIQRFINALLADLPNDYYFVCRHYSKTHRHYIMKIAPKGYSTELLHVDVFWLWDAGNDRDSVRKINSVLDKQRNALLWKTIDVRFLTIGQLNIVKAYCKIKQLIFRLIPAKFIDNIYLSSIKKFPGKGELLSDEYKIFNSSDFESKKEIELNDGNRYFIPVGYENILKSEYGNYLCYPAIESRISEMKSSFYRIREGEKITPTGQS